MPRCQCSTRVAWVVLLLAAVCGGASGTIVETERRDIAAKQSAAAVAYALSWLRDESNALRVPFQLDTIINQTLTLSAHRTTHRIPLPTALAGSLPYREHNEDTIMDATFHFVLSLKLTPNTTANATAPAPAPAPPATASTPAATDGTAPPPQPDPVAASASPLQSVVVQISVSSDRQYAKAVTRFVVGACPPNVCTAAEAAAAAAAIVPTPEADALIEVELAAAPATSAYATQFSSSISPDAGIAQTAPRPLSVACVNIWNYNHWQQRIPLLKRMFARINPDVVGFQEVRASKMSNRRESRYQIRDLSLLLPGYQFVYRPAMGFHDHAESELVFEGVAIFSRFPIINSSWIALSRDHPADEGDFHQRVLLRALIQTPDHIGLGAVNVLTTHLSLSEIARKRTLPEIGRYIKSLEDPSVLVGDFNQVLDQQNVLTTEFGLTDAWLEKYPNHEPSTGWTFSSWEPRARIDYIFLNRLKTSSITSTSSLRVRTGLPPPLIPIVRIVEGDRPEPMTGLKPVGGVNDMKDSLFPSDHFFLFAHVTAGDATPQPPSLAP